MGSNTNSMDPYNQYNQPGPYGGQPGFDPNCQEGDRGLGKKLAIGAGVAALAVGTAVVAGGIYHHHKKQKKKKTVYVNGKSRDIDCDVLVDDRGIELPGQQFDERGVCVTNKKSFLVLLTLNKSKEEVNNNGEELLHNNNGEVLLLSNNGELLHNNNGVPLLHNNNGVP